MTTIDPNSAQAALFEKLGLNKQSDAQKANSDKLGQSDFLKLMTTQLQNQDPFAPMDNGDFIAQMAQFSTVTGIQDMNASLGKLVEEFDQARIATASNLLGHSVLVPGNIGRPDDEGELHGVLDLPEATISTQLNYVDADTNNSLFKEDLGPRAAGLVGFKWSDIPEEILASNKRIKIEALIDTGNGPEQLSPSIYSKVISASVGTGETKQVLLNVEDYGDLDVSSAVNFR
ncbi:MAG: flagellar biosynthesis protein FlgJ [Marinovum sp.]|jgi:flagellar basal-body rod modification protein FlgD|nr:flagellar biosynthesis protein FlgJ [Marinovum sp.]